MKVYLSAKYGRRAELEAMAVKMEAAGHESMARWLSDDHRDDDKMMPFEAMAVALEDFGDIDRSEVFVAFKERAKSHPRGGRHVELGYAIAREKTVILVGNGKAENMFHALPCIMHVATFEDALTFLGAVRAGVEAASKMKATGSATEGT